MRDKQNKNGRKLEEIVLRRSEEGKRRKKRTIGPKKGIKFDTRL